MGMNKQVGKRESRKSKETQLFNLGDTPGKRDSQNPVPVFQSDSKEVDQQPEDEKVQQIY